MTVDEMISIATGGYQEIQEDWMPATGIRPLVFDDPALLWLAFYGRENGFQPDKSPYDFLDFIATKGRQFQEKWIREVAPASVVVCAQDYEVRSRKKVLETVEHIYGGAPVIVRPALWWAAERIYGVPDLIAHTSWVAEKFPHLIPQYEDESSAANLDPSQKPGHYVVLDIKFTTGLEDSDKKKDYANYSAQVRIYSYLLGQVQGLIPTHAYLVLRDRLFQPLPIKVTSTLGQSLDGDLAAVRDRFLDIKLNGSRCRPWTDAIVASNYSNQDSTWGTAKDLIAKERVPGRDPAILYQVSPSIKQELQTHGYSSLDSMLGVNSTQIPFEKCKGLGTKRSKLMRSILEANRSGKASKPNAATAPAVRKNEFYVDFEYFTNLNVDFEKQWPTLEGFEMVFMVGVGRTTDNCWSFKSFVAGAENADQEKQMFSEFIGFLSREIQGSLTDPSGTVLYHWTSAEVWQSRRSSDRLNFAADHPLRMLPWYDLQKPFLEGPAAIPGAWSYGLKEIARALGKYQPQLAVEWPESLSEGLNAMVMGWQAYTNRDPLISSEMTTLQKYLEVDCAALAAVLKWLRA